METGDRPSREGDGVADEGGYREGGRPSEEAIRARLIDRRKAFDEAEAGRRLADRFRQKMRNGRSSAPLRRRALVPARGALRALEALQNRPILAFAAAASLSAVILVPLALSSYAPLPGELPLPAATGAGRTAVTVQGETTPPPVNASLRAEAAATAQQRSSPIAPPAPDGSMFETLERREAAVAEPSANPAAAAKGASAQASGADAAPSSDPGLLDTATLRTVTPALPGQVTAGAGGSAEQAGMRSIDPVAAALALRLPDERPDARPDASTVAPTTLDPVSTGSISAAATGTAEAAEADATGVAMPDMETAGPAKSFITVSPSILIATSDEGGPEAVAPPAAGAVDDAAESAASTDGPTTAGAPASRTDGRATASVNLRAEPTNDGRIVAILAKGDAVTVVSCQGWCEVETASGQKGYVYEKFIARGRQG